MELPTWLAQTQVYVAPKDRDAFLRRNVLVLAGMLATFRAAPARGAESPVDRALAKVAPPVRLVGVLVLIALVSASRNLAFCWAALALFLATTAMRSPRAIAGVLKPARLLAAVAFAVNLPAALLLGQTAAPARMALKSFLTVVISVSTAQALGLAGVVEALRALHLPAQLVFTIETCVRDLGLLGEAAHSLAEALELRSVGRTSNKTAGTAGVLGMTFLRGHLLAQGQAEAMLLRGYDGHAPATRPHARLGLYDALYLSFVLCAIVLFVYLERAN